MAPKFIQISAAHDNLYALDEVGGVWRYYPARPATSSKRVLFANWVHLTGHREDSTGPKKGREEVSRRAQGGNDPQVSHSRAESHDPPF